MAQSACAALALTHHLRGGCCWASFQPGCGLSGPPGHRHRAVRTRRADRHRRAHPVARAQPIARPAGRGRQPRRRCRQHRHGAGGARDPGRPHAAGRLDRDRGQPGAVQEPAVRSDQGLRADHPSSSMRRTCWWCIPTPTSTSIADLIARAKAGAKFSYSSPGAGTKSHLTGELLKLRAGIDMVHVPYRGAGPAAQAVLGEDRPGRLSGAGGGRVPDPERAVACARGDQRKTLVLAAERADHDRGRLSRTSSPTPSMPSSRQPGAAGYRRAAGEGKRAAFQTAGRVRALARKAGFEIVAGTPDQLSARIKAEIPAVRELVAKAGIPLQ